MIGLFILLILTPKPYHDSGISTLISHAGLVESRSAFEEDFYPAVKKIDYQGFVRE